MTEASKSSDTRIPLLTPDEMNPAQRRVYDTIVQGPRGVMVGPLRAALHSPELAVRWSNIGEFLRYETSIPRHLNELAIVVTSRRWSSQVEWWIHADAARKAGIDDSVLDAICIGEAPVLEREDEAEIYEFTRYLQMDGGVPPRLYAAVQDRWGVPGTVELGAVIGYYTMVSMTLNLHELPLPDGVAEPLKPLTAEGLAALLPARRANGAIWQWDFAEPPIANARQG